MLGLAATLSAAGLIYLILPFTLQTGFAAGLKLANRATICPWSRVLWFWPEVNRFAGIYERVRKTTSLARQEDGLDLLATPGGSLWVRHENVAGNQAVYQMAEHQWVALTNPGDTVQRGDVVVDVGAHVGIFTRQALSLGASRVIAVEPDPGNIRCLERNFEQQIASGQVVIVPEGAWSSTSTMTLHLGASSAWNSLVTVPVGSGSIEVPVRPLDDMLAALHVSKVDFIKMDIEGAEREALAGAFRTLRDLRPRLMIDSYHRPDDMEVLPRVIRRAHADYQISCGPCETSQEGPRQLIPHVTFYR